MVYVFPDYTPDESEFWNVLKEDYVPRLHAQGQKVIMTYGIDTLLKDMKAMGYPNDSEGYKSFAKYIYDEKIDKFNLDGIDLDYEMTFSLPDDYQRALGVSKELATLMGEDRLFIIDTNKRSLDNFMQELAEDIDILNLQVYGDVTRRLTYYYGSYETHIPTNKIYAGFSFYEENDLNKWGDTEGSPETSRAGEYAIWQPSTGLKGGIFAFAIDRDGKQVGDDTISKTDYSWSIAYKNIMLQDPAYADLTLAEKNYPQLDWKKEVENNSELLAEDLILNKDRLEEHAEYEFLDNPDLTIIGEQTVRVRVGYSDGSEDILPARFVVVNSENPQPGEEEPEEPIEDPDKPNDIENIEVINIKNVTTKNKQINIEFDIASANGKGYYVYLSKDGEDFELYEDVNFNKKGVNIRNLKNGTEYTAYILRVDNGLIIERSEVIKAIAGK